MSREGKGYSLIALEAVEPAWWESMKVLFLLLLCSCCQQTLMSTLTWAGGAGAYQQVASRNQSSAFRMLSRDWDKRMGGAEGRKRQCMAVWHMCLPATMFPLSTYHEPGTILSHLGHSRVYVKREGSVLLGVFW